MRLVWPLERFTLDADGIRLGMEVFARSLGLAWQLDFDDRPDPVASFCSRDGHCLYDLLLRQRLGKPRRQAGP